MTKTDTKRSPQYYQNSMQLILLNILVGRQLPQTERQAQNTEHPAKPYQTSTDNFPKKLRKGKGNKNQSIKAFILMALQLFTV